MRVGQVEIDPFANDPGHWGASLANNGEVMIPVLDAVAPASIAEVGAYAGDLTGLLVQWAEGTETSVMAIDPFPQPELVDLAERHERLELVREGSLEALAGMPIAEAVVLDGDHNYWTLSEELRLIAERSEELPLLLFHDVSWPHARRDDYYDPGAVPAEHRHPYQEGGGVFPGVPGLEPGGLPYRYPAREEGGPANGVLTAVEDFVAARGDCGLAVVPAFFGLGVVWRHDAPWAPEVAALLEPWDRNPLLERMEANRVAHLATSHRLQVDLGRAGNRISRQEQILERLLRSSAFALAERLSRIRLRLGIGSQHAELSKDEIREALKR